MGKIQLIPLKDERSNNDNKSIEMNPKNLYDSLNMSITGGYNTQNVGIKGNLG